MNRTKTLAEGDGLADTQKDFTLGTSSIVEIEGII